MYGQACYERTSFEDLPRVVSTPREQPIVIRKGYGPCFSPMLLFSVPFRFFASDFASEEGHQISLEVSVGGWPWRRGVQLDNS